MLLYIEFLIEKGADINAKKNDGKTALALQIKSGKWTEVSEWLEKAAEQTE